MAIRKQKKNEGKIGERNVLRFPDNVYLQRLVNMGLL